MHHTSSLSSCTYSETSSEPGPQKSQHSWAVLYVLLHQNSMYRNLQLQLYMGTYFPDPLGGIFLFFSLLAFLSGPCKLFSEPWTSTKISKEVCMYKRSMNTCRERVSIIQELHLFFLSLREYFRFCFSLRAPLYDYGVFVTQNNRLFWKLIREHWRHNTFIL